MMFGRLENIIVIFYLLQYDFSIVAGSTLNNTTNNNRPIIGILAQEISYHLKHVYNNEYDSYIAASYVKYLESSGARVVPIWLGQTEDYYHNILKSINGVVFPGGSTYFNTSKGYAQSGEIIYKLAKYMNDNGDFFPLWGSCLGFELMLYLEANKIDLRSKCHSKNVALPLEFKPDFRESRLFEKAPDDIISILKNNNVTANFHVRCITENDLQKVNLTNEYRVISLNNDKNGIKFISTVEHYRYPFYGVQFHPEKNNFEWADRLIGIPHSYQSILISQYFGNFFINQARKSNHNFSSKKQEISSLIYNYPVTYTGPTNSSFEQCYLFKTLVGN